MNNITIILGLAWLTSYSVFYYLWDKSLTSQEKKKLKNYLNKNYLINLLTGAFLTTAAFFIALEQNLFSITQKQLIIIAILTTLFTLQSHKINKGYKDLNLKTTSKKYSYILNLIRLLLLGYILMTFPYIITSST